jgi:uncharacterized membrane protein YqjE
MSQLRPLLRLFLDLGVLSERVVLPEEALVLVLGREPLAVPEAPAEVSEVPAALAVLDALGALEVLDTLGDVHLGVGPVSVVQDPHRLLVTLTTLEVLAVLSDAVIWRIRAERKSNEKWKTREEKMI